MTGELALRIAHPALFAAMDDLVEKVAFAFPAQMTPPPAAVVTMPDLTDPQARERLLKAISIAEMLDQGYDSRHVARLHGVRAA